MIAIPIRRNALFAGRSGEALFRTRTGDPFLTMEGPADSGSRPESSRVVQSGCTPAESDLDSGHPRTTPDDKPADAELTRNRHDVPIA